MADGMSIAEMQSFLDAHINGASDKNVDAILQAGAAAALSVYTRGVQAAGHVGAERVLIKSVTATPPKTGYIGRYSVVKFDGRDERRGHGISNKNKAFVIDNDKKASTRGIYGRHTTPDPRFKGTRGDHFITKTGTGIHDTALDAATEAMYNKYHEIMGE